MNIDMRDILTLSDDNKYVIVSKKNYNGKNYYYLVDINSNTNIKFCMEDGVELVEIEDQELIQTLILLFASEAQAILKEIMEQS